jgi:hypothetical protein
MAGFGAKTDPWGFADTKVNLTGYSASGQGSSAQCQDSLGNIVEETTYDTGQEVSATYSVCAGHSAVLFDSDTAAPVDFRLGKVISGNVITSIEVARSNTSNIEITISGENTSEADSDMAKFTPAFPSGYLAGGKGAIAAGIVISAGKVISSSVSASCSVAKSLDSDGAQACKAIYAGRLESNNELMSCDTIPAAVADTANGWTLNSAPSLAESNTAYPTGTFGAYANLDQD